LTDADAEQMEAQHWSNVAASCSYLSHDKMEQLVNELSRVGRILNSMMRKADLFCGESANKPDRGDD